MRSCSRSTSRALASPSRWVRAVEPSTSVNRTVRKVPASSGSGGFPPSGSPSRRHVLHGREQGRGVLSRGGDALHLVEGLNRIRVGVRHEEASEKLAVRRNIAPP